MKAAQDKARAAAASRRTSRLLALRAIMDGRGVTAVVLRDPQNVVHYAGRDASNAAVLVVTASKAVLLAPVRGDGDGQDLGLRIEPVNGAADLAAAVIAAVGQAQRVGYDRHDGPPLGHGEMLALGPLIARQVAAADAGAAIGREGHEKGPLPRGQGAFPVPDGTRIIRRG